MIFNPRAHIEGVKGGRGWEIREEGFGEAGLTPLQNEKKEFFLMGKAKDVLLYT